MTRAAREKYENAAALLAEVLLDPEKQTSGRFYTLAQIWKRAGTLPDNGLEEQLNYLTQALFWAERTLSEGDKVRGWPILAEVLGNLGMVSKYSGNLSTAEEQLSRAIEFLDLLLFEKANDAALRARAQARLSLASVLKQLMDIDRADRMIDLAIYDLKECLGTAATNIDVLGDLIGALVLKSDLQSNVRLKTEYLAESLDLGGPLVLVDDPDPTVADGVATAALSLSKAAVGNPELGIDFVGPARWAVEIRRNMTRQSGNAEDALRSLAVALHQFGVCLVPGGDIKGAIAAVCEEAELHARADQLATEPAEILHVIALIALAELHELADEDLEAISVARKAAEVAGGMSAGDPSGSSDPWWRSISTTIIFLLYRSVGVSAFVDSEEREQYLLRLGEAYRLRETYLVEANRMGQAAEELRDLEAVLDPLGLKLP